MERNLAFSAIPESGEEVSADGKLSCVAGFCLVSKVLQVD